MPSALYAISYRPTASVVAVCSLEQQELPDRPSWLALLETLVGTGLPISLPTRTGSFEIPVHELGCDLVRPPSQKDLEDVLAEPYQFRVTLDPGGAGTVQPGDGQEKVLRRAGENAVQSIALNVKNGAPPQVQVTLASRALEGIEARLLFEGEPAPRVPSATRDATVSDLCFTPSNVTITPGATYGVMFFMAGVPVEARSVRAPDRAETPAPAAPPAGTPPKATP